MANAHPGLGLEQYHSMSVDRRHWQAALQHATRAANIDSPIRPQLMAMERIGHSQPMWDLVLVASAYLTLGPVEPIGPSGVSDLYAVATALNSIRGRESMDNFHQIATAVSQTPLNSLHRIAPKIAPLLWTEKTLTAANVACMVYCLTLHPNDSGSFWNCMETC